ncbi:MAG: 2Fe-2S iron-sulfur cluster-binding protein, partial [Candidatus Heritagella sp.]
MSTLTLWQNGHTRELNFQKTPLLREVLAEAGIPLDHPCAGRGICGKCAVEITGEISPPNEAERRAGHRLACQIMLLGDARVWLPESGADRVEISGAAVYAENPMEGQWGAAVDIGTTTLALKLFNLKSGAMLAARGEINPQRSVAADVMGRIGAALEGQGPH